MTTDDIKKDVKESKKVIERTEEEEIEEPTFAENEEILEEKDNVKRFKFIKFE